MFQHFLNVRAYVTGPLFHQHPHYVQPFHNKYSHRLQHGYNWFMPDANQNRIKAFAKSVLYSFTTNAFIEKRSRPRLRIFLTKYSCAFGLVVFIFSITLVCCGGYDAFEAPQNSSLNSSPRNSFQNPS